MKAPFHSLDGTYDVNVMFMCVKDNISGLQHCEVSSLNCTLSHDLSRRRPTKPLQRTKVSLL